MGVMTIVLPNGTQPSIGVPNDVLVYDGLQFVPPGSAEFVTVARVGTESTYASLANAILNVRTSTKACVKSWDPNASLPPDLNLLTATDPSEGQCVCLITCEGALISYIKFNPN